MLRAVLGNRGHIYGGWETRRRETAGIEDWQGGIT